MTINDLKCCGNCKYYEHSYPNDYCDLSCLDIFVYNYCDDWEYDKRSQKEKDVNETKRP